MPPTPASESPKPASEPAPPRRSGPPAVSELIGDLLSDERGPELRAHLIAALGDARRGPLLRLALEEQVNLRPIAEAAPAASREAVASWLSKRLTDMGNPRWHQLLAQLPRNAAASWDALITARELPETAQRLAALDALAKAVRAAPAAGELRPGGERHRAASAVIYDALGDPAPGIRQRMLTHIRAGGLTAPQPLLPLLLDKAQCCRNHGQPPLEPALLLAHVRWHPADAHLLDEAMRLPQDKDERVQQAGIEAVAQALSQLSRLR